MATTYMSTLPLGGASICWTLSTKYKKNFNMSVQSVKTVDQVLSLSLSKHHSGEIQGGIDACALTDDDVIYRYINSYLYTQTRTVNTFLVY